MFCIRLAVALLVCSAAGFGGTTRVSFTLDTTDEDGAAIQESRYYYVYRPDNIPKSTAVPAILVMEASPNSGAASFLSRKADQAGFLVVSCSFSGNSTGTPGTTWNNDNPRITGFEDYDYITAVIKRVKASDNANDFFISGLSKGGHTSLAYACERPSTIRAAASIDEFMQSTLNVPSAPLPIIIFQGTMDSNVPYTMVKDSLDIWRAVDGLLSVTPFTTYESSPLILGKVSQTTWRGGINGTQVAMVTIIGGTHAYALPTSQTGYDFTDGMWAFFSQFLSAGPDAPKIVSQPSNGVHMAGSPATFRVAAAGEDPLAYQWQKNGADIPGATERWYTTPRTSLADNGAAYRVLVTNGSGTVTSSAAVLTVKAAPDGPSITIQPADQAVSAGQPAAFAVEAAGNAPLRYQWLKNGMSIAGGTETTLEIPAAITSDCGATLSAVVTDATGNSITTNRATLTVTPAPGAPIVLTNPARARALVGQKATFTVAAWSASPMRYQWQKGTGMGNMADIPGATDAAYTTPATVLADHLTLLRCVVSNDAGSVTSASEMLFVTAARTAPNEITSVTSVATQAGEPFQYTITATGGTAPVAYSASPLPAGLTVDAASGLISGTPAEAGTTKAVIDAANSAGHISRVLTLTVTADPPVVSLEAWRLANFGASAIDPSIAGDAADPDGDGYSNLVEYTSGTNPLDASSAPNPLPGTPSAGGGTDRARRRR